MSAFGQAGVGFLAKPSAIADMITRQYDLQLVGSTEEIKEHFYAITVQRKITHPAVLAISRAAPLAIINGKLQAKARARKAHAKNKGRTFFVRPFRFIDYFVVTQRYLLLRTLRILNRHLFQNIVSMIDFFHHHNM